MLSDQMKDAIYQKVMTDGDALKAVSEEMGVDVRRVAAVIRLKQVEKNWVKEVSLFYFSFFSLSYVLR